MAIIQIGFHLFLSFFQVMENHGPGVEIGMEVVGVLVPTLDSRDDYRPSKLLPVDAPDSP